MIKFYEKLQKTTIYSRWILYNSLSLIDWKKVMKQFYHERGFSAWTLLPWLLFITLAFVFWWFVNEKNNGVVQPITPAQVAPIQAVEPVKPSLALESQTPVLSYHEAVKKASVSVVNIYTTQKINNPYADDPLFQEFLKYHGYQMPENGETNLGSGVIVSADGYIVTNAHVIEKADEIVVALSDGRKAKASIVGADTESDLAVIKVELNNLMPITMKNQAVQVGDVTLAIGNPFGVGQTVTQGIVSATGRTGLGMNTFENFIQTDASINPGNSGGALVDAEGELIGINTMIYSRSGGSMGIGFAIPTDTVQKVMGDIISTGKVSRGWLGIEVGRVEQNPASLESTKGVIVAGLTANAPAQQAGVLVGDIILAVDGVAINDSNTLIQTIAKKAPNSTIMLDIIRAGKAMQLTATLGERPTVNPNGTITTPNSSQNSTPSEEGQGVPPLDNAPKIEVPSGQ